MADDPRFSFHRVDTSGTQAGRILEAGEIQGSTGTGWIRPRYYPVRAAVLLVGGRGIYRDTLGFETRVSSGDLLLVNPRIGHTYGPEGNRDWNEYYVSFEGPVFDSLEACGVLEPSRPVRRSGDPDLWRNRFLSLFPPLNLNYEPKSSEQLGGLVAFLLAADQQSSALESATVSPAWLARATNILSTPGESTTDLKAVAKLCGMGYENFRKQFTLLSGESPAAFRRHALIDRAQSLMRNRDLTDRAIAGALGFCDEFHFSKTFKQVVGISPREWRKSHGPA